MFLVLFYAGLPSIFDTTAFYKFPTKKLCTVFNLLMLHVRHCHFSFIYYYWIFLFVFQPNCLIGCLTKGNTETIVTPSFPALAGTPLPVKNMESPGKITEDYKFGCLALSWSSTTPTSNLLRCESTQQTNPIILQQKYK